MYISSFDHAIGVFNNMTHKERVMAILSHKEADKVPLDFGAAQSCRISMGIYRKLIKHFGIQEEVRCYNKPTQIALASDAFMEKLECDFRAPFPIQKNLPSEEWEDTDGFFLRDAWGTVMRMPKKGGYYYDMVSAPLAGNIDNEEAEYIFPPLPDIVSEAAEQAEAYQKAGYPVIIPDQYGNGFLQTGPKIFGYEDWMMMLALNDKRAEQFLENLLERKMHYWDSVVAVFGGNIDIVCELDDLGTQTGPFINPVMLREKIKPYYRKLFDYIHKITKAKVYMHSCGSVSKVIPDLIEAGVDILNPVQISAADMDPAFLKREFGKDIVFWGGGIDTQKILPQGKPSEIRDHVKRNIEIFSKDGGFVFSAVHNVQSDVPPENFLAMWEAFREFRNY